MTEKNFNSRIIHKHDIEANWIKAVNFKPLFGEIIIYDADENFPHPRVKIGDGVTLVNNLPFAVDYRELDSSLTKEGAVAEAKAVGDAIAKMNYIYAVDDGQGNIVLNGFANELLDASGGIF